jgi:hypothetical protein
MSEEPVARELTHPLLFTAAISSVGALAAALRSKRQLSTRQVAAAVLTSTVAGVIVGLLLAPRLGDDTATLVGVSSLAGIGGANTLDFLLEALRAKAGIK